MCMAFPLSNLNFHCPLPSMYLTKSLYSSWHMVCHVRAVGPAIPYWDLVTVTVQQHHLKFTKCSSVYVQNNMRVLQNLTMQSEHYMLDIKFIIEDHAPFSGKTTGRRPLDRNSQYICCKGGVQHFVGVDTFDIINQSLAHVETKLMTGASFPMEAFKHEDNAHGTSSKLTDQIAMVKWQPSSSSKIRVA
ncbi:hypothetical protein ARMGADRAFT_1037773 [Armillaria gallica]|uniref:Uncharacterized protein n=1 Tax=Armillaria gallica TaxID=47427 RepID=A0A2H3D5J8_ARMGA|nr:hypothetical protein ARMGADRAFT_1037773 [Armillaria gallica]